MMKVEEVHITSMAEPAQVRIERNSKGYNFEVSVHSETMLGENGAVKVALLAKEQLEKALYTQVQP